MSNQGAPYVGAAAGADAGGMVEPMRLKANDIVEAATLAAEEPSDLLNLSADQRQVLLSYLKSRLSGGVLARNRRVARYASIDRAISTWQRLNEEDSERKRMEENSGKAQPIPFNLPVMASHLNDMASYFAEALAPIANPFFSSSGDDSSKVLLGKMNRDALRRDYYGQLNLTVRSLLKYNVGGLHVDWDDGSSAANGAKSMLAQPGNHWKTTCMYNTVWDPSIRRAQDVSQNAEWAATFEVQNRLTIVKRALSGKWVHCEGILEKNAEVGQKASYYKEPPLEAGVGSEGEDGTTGKGTGGSKAINWDSYGIGMAGDLGPDVDGFEITTMYCWLIPDQFGLLDVVDKQQVTDAGKNPKVFLELWKFVLIGNEHLVAASPLLDRADFLADEAVEIPIYLSYLTQDQLREAQRSMMELMAGFQRFASSMYSIYVNGMRKNVYGLQAYDPNMFDMSKISAGEVVGRVPSKLPGRDVRTGITNAAGDAGVDNALRSVGESLQLKDQFFPSQALPSQVAGIDRAVKSQVTTVIQGTQRSLRTLLRVLDSSMMLPTRLAAFRNLKRNDQTGIESLTDEDVAKLVGSGIESMESERVAEALWQLLYAIVQNQESMQRFDVPQLLTYISRVANLTVDLGQFARMTPEEQQAQAQAQAAPQQQAPAQTPTV